MLTAERVRELLEYDPETGVFRWRALPSIKATRSKAGAIAGCSDGRYWGISIEKRRAQAHRLAWLYMTGDWPKFQIDHIDGDKINNRFANLRDVPPAMNQHNQIRPQKTNSTGFLGVVPVRTKFRAQIWVDGAAKNLGTYLTAEAAHAAYVVAKRRLHAGCTI